MDVLFGKHVAVGDLVAADVHVVEPHAVHRRRRIVGSVHGLPRTVYRRRNEAHIAGLLADILQVTEPERFHVVGAEPHAAPHVSARMNHNHVRPHLADLRLDAPFGALADGQHGDDRRDPDDDAEHREESAQLVVAERPDRDFEKIGDMHGLFVLTGQPL